MLLILVGESGLLAPEQLLVLVKFVVILVQVVVVLFFILGIKVDFDIVIELKASATFG